MQAIRFQRGGAVDPELDDCLLAGRAELRWGLARESRPEGEVGWMALRVAHPSVDERTARGRKASSHSGWRPAVDRPDPVALLKEQDLTTPVALSSTEWTRIRTVTSRGRSGRPGQKWLAQPQTTRHSQHNADQHAETHQNHVAGRGRGPMLPTSRQRDRLTTREHLQL